MAQQDASFAVKESWRKTQELSTQSSDGLLSVMSNGQEAMTVALSKDFDRRQIQRALLTLDSVRKASMQFEDPNPDSVRIAAYELIKSLHVTLAQLTERIEELQHYKDKNLPKATLEQFMQTDEVAFPNVGGDGMTIKEEDMLMGDMDPNYDPIYHDDDTKREEIDDFQPIFAENEMSALDELRDGTPFKEEETDDAISREGDTADMHSLNEQPMENPDETGHDEMSRMGDTVHMNPLNAQPLENADETAQYEPLAQEFADDGGHDMMMMDDPIEEEGEKDKAVDDAVQKTKDSDETMEVDKTRRSSRNVPKPPNYADEEVEPAVKKRRSDAMKTSGMNTPKGQATNKGAAQSGSSSNGQIRRVLDVNNMTTPQCILCDKYPTTPIGYMMHLARHHKPAFTLISNGIYLKCSCGLDIVCLHVDPNHTKTCNGRQFTLHRLDED